MHDDRPVPDRQLLRRRRLLQHARRAGCARRATSAPAPATAPPCRSAPPSRTAAARPARRAATPAPATAPAPASRPRPPCRAARRRASGSTFTPVSHCNGTGALRAARPRPAARPTLCSGAACRTSCTLDARLRGAVHLPGHGAQPELRAQAQRPGVHRRPTSASAATASTASAAAAPAARPARRATSPAARDVHATSPPARAAPTGQCPAAPPCGNTGACNGAGGCQQAAATMSCGLALSCTGTTFQPASFCSGSGTCSQAAHDQLRRVRLRHQQHLPHRLHVGRALREQQPLLHGQRTTPGSCVAKKAPGAACGAAQRVRHRLLHRRRLLQRRDAAATCQSCNVNGSAGTCANVAAGTAAPPDCAASARRAATPAPATARAPASRPRPASIVRRRRLVHRDDLPAAVVLLGGGHVHQPARRLRRVRLRRPTPARPPAPATATARPATTARATRCVGQTKTGSARPAAPPTSAAAASAPTASAAAPRAARLPGVQPQRQPGTCANVAAGIGRPARPLRGRTAPAATPAPATAAAPARSSRASVTVRCRVSCIGHDVPAAVVLQRQRHLQPGRARRAAARTSAARRRCLSSCNGDDDCVSGYFCTGTAAPAWPRSGLGAACGARRRVHQRQLRRRRLLQHRSLRDLPGVQPERPRDLRERRRRASAIRTAAARRTAVRQHRRLQRRRRLHAAADHGRRAAAPCPARGSTYQPPSFCSGSGACSQMSTQSCSPYVCGTGMLPSRAATATATASAATTAPAAGGSCLPKKAPGASCGGATTNARPATASTASAATAAAAGPARRATSPAASGPAARSPTAPRSRTAVARPTTRPAATTGRVQRRRLRAGRRPARMCAGAACTVGDGRSSPRRRATASAAAWLRHRRRRTARRTLCGGASGCRNSCAGDSDCVGGHLLRRRQLRAEARPRPRLRERRPVRQQPLRRQLLLRHGELRCLSALRHRRQPGDVRHHGPQSARFPLWHAGARQLRQQRPVHGRAPASSSTSARVATRSATPDLQVDADVLRRRGTCGTDHGGRAVPAAAVQHQTAAFSERVPTSA